MGIGWAQRWWPPLLAGMLVVGVAATAMFARPAIHSVSPHSGPVRHVSAGHPITVPAAAPVAAGFRVPGWLATAILVATGILLAVAAILLIVYFTRRYRTARRLRTAWPGFADTVNGDYRDDVLAAVDAGIADLIGDETDPRAAVIACWVRLEQVAAEVGIPRSPGETSSDLVARLLLDQQVSTDVLTSLAELYRAARYSTRVIESSMRDAARESLRRLRNELVPHELVPRDSALAAGR